ncbi:hypothetical protein KC614_00630 [candidate division WWE3 bacterium]|uniref:Uncharacterized protein n=1 Tax=candidate division WWE3 bacterium TaxID=2053526 RepID=A0A955LK63_UNCKA|nr:hypothetical protein [candidate division WWE3 bacterium]
MKCISCGKETEKVNNLMCAACSGKFISSVVPQKETAHPETVITPKSPNQVNTQKAKPSPNVSALSSAAALGDTPTPQPKISTQQAPAVPNSLSLDNRLRIPTDTDQMPSDGKTMRMVLAGLSVTTVIAALLIVVYFVAVVPTKDVVGIADSTELSLNEAEQVFSDTLKHVNNMVNYYQDVQEERQIGTIQEQAQRLAFTANIDSKNMVGDESAGQFGDVAGSNTLAYDAEVEAQSQLVYTAKSYSDLAIEKQEAVEKIEGMAATSTINEDLLAKIKAASAAGREFVDDVDVVVGFEEFSIVITKRLDDMTVALDQAFETNDLDIFVKTIGEISDELSTYQAQFAKLPKPEGSEGLSESLSSTLTSMSDFFGEYEIAFKTGDPQRIVNATNRFLVDYAKYANRSEDDVQAYVSSLTLGAKLDHWRSTKSVLLNAINKAANGFAYKIVSILPF